MQRTINRKDGAILIGILMLIWSITSAFADLVYQTPVSPIDRLDDRSARIVPTRQVTLTAFSPSAVSTAGDKSSLLEIPTIAPFMAAPNPSQPAPTNDNAFLAPFDPHPSATPIAQPQIPDRLVIPAINLDAPVLPSNYRLIDLNGTVFQQWEAPEQFAAGWQSSSATLGIPGNTVFDGHHNIYGEVFGHLIDLTLGDTIQVYSGSAVFTYEITNKMILPEKDQDISVRMENARWMQTSTDQRLTLITCWPQWSNTHRLIIVAKPSPDSP